jgi:hypothetical protein
MSGDQPKPTVASFGPFEADFQTQEIRRHGVHLRLPGQSFQILRMLLERPGELVARAKLREALWPWDTSLFKNTSISERVDVQFRVEATNVLNHTNFDQIGTFFLDPIHFGQVMSARDARIIQLGLKVLF